MLLVLYYELEVVFTHMNVRDTKSNLLHNLLVALILTFLTCIPEALFSCIKKALFSHTDLLCDGTFDFMPVQINFCSDFILISVYHPEINLGQTRF